MVFSYSRVYRAICKGGKQTLQVSCLLVIFMFEMILCLDVGTYFQCNIVNNKVIWCDMGRWLFWGEWGKGTSKGPQQASLDNSESYQQIKRRLFKKTSFNTSHSVLWTFLKWFLFLFLLFCRTTYSLFCQNWPELLHKG